MPLGQHVIDSDKITRSMLARIQRIHYIKRTTCRLLNMGDADEVFNCNDLL